PVEDAGREVAERILREPIDLDALVCGNDQLALAVSSRLTAGRVRVPEDLAVTRWDDTVAARCITPRLTTLRQEIEQLAALAAARRPDQRLARRGSRRHRRPRGAACRLRRRRRRLGAPPSR